MHSIGNRSDYHPPAFTLRRRQQIDIIKTENILKKSMRAIMYKKGFTLIELLGAFLILTDNPGRKRFLQ
jgi:hypothetical protein